MDHFLPQKDALSQLIQEKAVDLYARLHQLPVDDLGMPAHCLNYFKASHSERLFFSIETSAHLLYKALTQIKKDPNESIIMDYGAGVGTLYLLAKLIGCRKVIYNDHLDEWRLSAQLIAEALHINIDSYIVGDIEECLKQLKEDRIDCDIIASRNVVEHIYKLDQFYSAVHRDQPNALVFSSTTANYWNPASRVKHFLWHRRWEKVFRLKRQIVIRREAPGLSVKNVQLLSRSTRGLADKELTASIYEYLRSRKYPNPSQHRSNTCEPSTGVWAEHMLKGSEYRKLINESAYTISFAPGFWDTHYSEKYKRSAGKLFNKMIAGGGLKAMRLAPFIYVIAQPRIS